MDCSFAGVNNLIRLVLVMRAHSLLMTLTDKEKTCGFRGVCRCIFQPSWLHRLKRGETFGVGGKTPLVLIAITEDDGLAEYKENTSGGYGLS